MENVGLKKVYPFTFYVKFSENVKIVKFSISEYTIVSPFTVFQDKNTNTTISSTNPSCVSLDPGVSYVFIITEVFREILAGEIMKYNNMAILVFENLKLLPGLFFVFKPYGL